MPELRISTEKVCEFIEAASEFAGKVPPATGDHTTTGDDSKLVTIEDYPGEDEAEARIAARDPDFMIGDAALPQYLGDGLEAFDRSCD